MKGEALRSPPPPSPPLMPEQMLRYDRRLSWKGHGLDSDEAAKSYILSLAINPEGDRLLSGGLDGFARIWDLSTGRLLGEVNLQLPVTCVEWPSHRRDWFYVGCSAGTVASCIAVGTVRSLSELVEGI